MDYTKYFDYTGIPQPSNEEGIGHFLTEEGLLVREDSGLYAITNLGVILFSKKLSAFERLGRKAVRVVQYDGNNRLLTLKDDTQDEQFNEIPPHVEYSLTEMGRDLLPVFYSIMNWGFKHEKELYGNTEDK